MANFRKDEVANLLHNLSVKVNFNLNRFYKNSNDDNITKKVIIRFYGNADCTQIVTDPDSGFRYPLYYGPGP